MEFFHAAVETLETLTIALGAGLGVWGLVTMLEGYGNDNAGSNGHGSEGSKCKLSKYVCRQPTDDI